MEKIRGNLRWYPKMDPKTDPNPPNLPPNFPSLQSLRIPQIYLTFYPIFNQNPQNLPQNPPTPPMAHQSTPNLPQFQPIFNQNPPNLPRFFSLSNSSKRPEFISNLTEISQIYPKIPPPTPYPRSQSPICPKSPHFTPFWSILNLHSGSATWRRWR